MICVYDSTSSCFIYVKKKICWLVLPYIFLLFTVILKYILIKLQFTAKLSEWPSSINVEERRMWTPEPKSWKFRARIAGDIKLMVIDEGFPLDFTGEV